MKKIIDKKCRSSSKNFFSLFRTLRQKFKHFGRSSKNFFLAQKHIEELHSPLGTIKKNYAYDYLSLKFLYFL